VPQPTTLPRAPFSYPKKLQNENILSYIYSYNIEITIFIAVEFSCEKDIFISRSTVWETLIRMMLRSSESSRCLASAVWGNSSYLLRQLCEKFKFKKDESVKQVWMLTWNVKLLHLRIGSSKPCEVCGKELVRNSGGKLV
jgi:hypothetical protein